MKNQYVGDSGDYGKYGLLRFLARQGVSIAVNWYLTPGDETNDGSYRGYLKQDKYRAFDPELYDALRKLCQGGTPTVNDIARLDLIPGAVYYGEPLPPRQSDRALWHEAALRACDAADLVFCDPDVGLLPATASKAKAVGKYAFPDELADHYRTGKDVVYYCHRTRETESAWRRTRCAMRVHCPDAFILSLTYHKDAQRCYVFLIHPEHKTLYVRLADAFLDTQWGALFDSERLTSESHEGIIAPAQPTDLELIYDIVQETIAAVYPHYYPAGAVAFFQAHHSRDAIRADLAARRVWLLWHMGRACGTVTIRNNEMTRLFVPPEQQGRGYGWTLMDFAEKKIAERYDEIVLDASLSAKGTYQKRGYVECEYHRIPTENGQFLCYDVMRKRLKPEP